jgi:hypothetical protein
MKKSAAKQNPQRERGRSTPRTCGGRLAQSIKNAAISMTSFAADSVTHPTGHFPRLRACIMRPTMYDYNNTYGGGKPNPIIFLT